MTDLKHRAEQAVLGAMLSGGTQVGELNVRDFGDRRHQAIFAALSNGTSGGQGVLSRLRQWLTSLPHLSEARGIRAYMAELPAACPDPDHMDSYVEMITEGRRQREATAEVERNASDVDRLLGAATYLVEQAKQIGASNGRVHPSEPKSPEADGLPRDIAALSNALNPKRQDAQPAPAPSQPTAHQEQVRTPDSTNEPAAQRLRDEDLQDLVLADLLHHPEEAKSALEWLPADVFAAHDRRALYDTIRDKVSHRLPVDPLIIAWEARHPAEEARAESVLDAEYVLRVGALAVAPGTAEILGCALLADHICTQRYGADWPQSPELAEPDVRQAPEPDPELVHGQSVPAADVHDRAQVVPVPVANGHYPTVQEPPPDLPAWPAPEPRM